jgi:organic radical activating enzyme
LKTKTILELFYSIQGEGLRIGLPSIFVRFTGCNLKCPWCDTKYSWDEAGVFSTDYVLNFIKSSKNVNELVFTGGEPLLNQDSILEIINKYPDLNYTIETNGTIIPFKELAENKSILWSVSPKLFLTDWDKNVPVFDNYKKVQFKFVIDNLVKDIEKIQGLHLNHPVIVQPNGQKDNYSLSCRELAEKVLMLKLNFRVLPQFHKICWGTQRGI